MTRHILAFAVSLFLAACAFASREGILPFSRFHIESDGINSSGKIIVEGQQDDKDRLIALVVIAFGKSYSVPQDKLAKLAELPSNGVRISYEQGYPEFGGRTVYVQLQMGFTESLRKAALITLHEDGNFEISSVQYAGEDKKEISIPLPPLLPLQPAPENESEHQKNATS